MLYWEDIPVCCPEFSPASYTLTTENIKAFADAVIKAKPTGAKGNYVKRVAISSTMGPGVKIDPSTVA